MAAGRIGGVAEVVDDDDEPRAPLAGALEERRHVRRRLRRRLRQRGGAQRAPELPGDRRAQVRVAVAPPPRERHAHDAQRRRGRREHALEARGDGGPAAALLADERQESHPRLREEAHDDALDDVDGEAPARGRRAVAALGYPRYAVLFAEREGRELAHGGRRAQELRPARRVGAQRRDAPRHGVLLAAFALSHCLDDRPEARRVGVEDPVELRLLLRRAQRILVDRGWPLCALVGFFKCRCHAQDAPRQTDLPQNCGR